MILKQKNSIVAALLVFSSLFFSGASYATSQNNSTWETNDCEMVMEGFPTRLDEDVFHQSMINFQNITDPNQFLGRAYSFEEMLAVTDRHLELNHSDQLENYRSWIQTIFFKEKNVVIRQQSVDLTPEEWMVDWNKNWGKLKQLKNRIRKIFVDSPARPLIRSIGKASRLFSANESYRKSDFIIDWKKIKLANEKELFIIEEDVLELLARAQYHKLRYLEPSTFLKPGRYFSKNFKLVRDNYILQYQLNGESGVEPTTLEVANESLGLMKNLSLDMLWPAPPLVSRTNAMMSWIYKNYGQKGLTFYLYFKKGPKAALDYGIKNIIMMNIIGLATMATIYTGTIHRMYTLYAPMDKMVMLDSSSPGKAIAPVMSDGSAIPIEEEEPMTLSDTITKNIPYTHFTAEEKNEIKALSKRLKQEVKLKTVEKSN